MDEMFIMLTALTQCSVCVSVCVCMYVCEEEKQHPLWSLTLNSCHCTHTSSATTSCLTFISSSTSTWSVGSLGEILRTDDGGLSWLSLSSRLPYAVRGSSTVFHSLSTLSPSGVTSRTHSLSLFLCPLKLYIYFTLSSRPSFFLTFVHH